jgi:hypothetical protein
MGNTRNTGYLQNIVQYDASDNITLPARLAVTSTVAINNTTPYDTTQFSLDVNGGLIVKNINKTAQFVLINSNPATGGNNAFVVHTVGGTSGSSYADIQGYYGTSIAGSTVIRLNPQGGNVLVGSLAGTGSRMVVADSTGVLSTQAIITLGDLSGVPYTGATANVDLGTYGLVSDYLQLNTSPTSVPTTAGTMAWNDTDGTLDIKLKGGNVTLQVGQETLYEVRNERGTTIPNGTAVYANGVTAGSSRITVDAYIADGSIRENRFLGLATEDISNGVNGFVTHFGYVRGLDTRGTAVSSISVGDENWSVGDILYVHPTVPGKLTNVKPQHEVTVAIVINRHQSSGVLFVRPSSAGHLEDIHDISISSPSNGDILQYVSSTGLWTKAAGTTTSIAEGTNLYYTTARANSDFDTRLATKSTTNLAEGTNLYYTDARVGAYLTANSYATQTYVNTAVSNLVDAAPGTLDTLNELAAALGDDPNFATTVATSIGTKVPNTRTITINETAYDLSADRSWTINSMVYPGAGIPLSTGTAWGTSITNNSTNWNTAYGWGNHASASYLTSITSSQVTTALGYTPVTNARTITINGTAYDLSADRSWTISSAGSGTATYLPIWNTGGATLGDSKISQPDADNVVINHGGAYSLGATFRYGGTYISEFHLGRTNTGADSKASIIYDIAGAEIFELRRNYTAASFKISLGSTAHLTISNTGAATFNSTITSGGIITAPIFFSSNRSNTIDTDDGVSNNFQGYGGYWALRTDTNNGFNLDVYGNGSPKNALNISQVTGAATFSNNLTLSNADSTTDLGGVLIVRGNGSTYSTHYLTTGAVNVAAYYQYDASGTVKNLIHAGANSYITGGGLGIGLTTPQAILDVSHTAGTTNIIRVSNGSGNYRWRVDQNFAMIMTNASGTDTFSVSTSGSISTPAQFTSFATAPLSFQGNGNTGTYTQTTIYANQNNTSGDVANGIFIERGYTDTSNTEVRHFVIGARGGTVQWKMNGAGYTTQYDTAEVKARADGLDLFVGRYSAGAAKLFRVYQSGADGYLELQTGAGDIVTKLSGYGGAVGYTLAPFSIGQTTQSAGAKLSVLGTTIAANFATNQSGAGSGLCAYFVNNSASGYSSFIYIGSAPGTDWKIGKNISNPTATTYHFEIVDSSNNLRMQINNGTGNATFSSDVIAYSDIRLKKNIRPIKDPLEKILKCNGILYDRIDTTEVNTFGFIAQELEEVFPELVTTNELGIKGVKYQNAVAILFEALKEQQTQIESQKSEIEELKDLVQQLINR